MLAEKLFKKKDSVVLDQRHPQRRGEFPLFQEPDGCRRGGAGVAGGVSFRLPAGGPTADSGRYARAVVGPLRRRRGPGPDRHGPVFGRPHHGPFHLLLGIEGRRPTVEDPPDDRWNSGVGPERRRFGPPANGPVRRRTQQRPAWAPPASGRASTCRRASSRPWLSPGCRSKCPPTRWSKPVRPSTATPSTTIPYPKRCCASGRASGGSSETKKTKGPSCCWTSGSPDGPTARPSCVPFRPAP